MSNRDEQAFERLVTPYRRELLAHCYRMLGGVTDAEDALQETLVAAWRGLDSFEGRSSSRTWLYRIATRVCIRLGEKRPPRMLSFDRRTAALPATELTAPVLDDGWLEPWPHDADPDTDPEARYSQREAVELAFVAALQHLPPNQRAVLILRDVLAFSADETARLLDTSTASVTSALQRARAAVPARTQQQEQVEAGQRRTVEAFTDAFVRRDVSALVSLLTEDVRFTMPPLPAWFDGRDDVVAFFAERVFADPWQAVRVPDMNGQPAIAGYQKFELGALIMPSFRDGRIDWISTFVDPDLLLRCGLPKILLTDR
jgi:RNA polymerase sigma-70 factor (ECF subfamily)